MRKIIVLTFVSMDGVMQAPSGLKTKAVISNMVVDGPYFDDFLF